MERLPMVVVDTSVVVKWFVPEADSDIALALRLAHSTGKIPLATADLCLVELANALRFRKPTPTAAEIGQAVRSVLSLDVRTVTPSPELIESATRLAFERQLTVYDALFVALAADLGYELVTADNELVARCRDLSWVRPLSAWKAP
jgi:predicted nucleic acid-binding protein